jgi:hypothetical protein
MLQQITQIPNKISTWWQRQLQRSGMRVKMQFVRCASGMIGRLGESSGNLHRVWFYEPHLSDHLHNGHRYPDPVQVSSLMQASRHQLVPVDMLLGQGTIILSDEELRQRAFGRAWNSKLNTSKSHTV